MTKFICPECTNTEMQWDKLGRLLRCDSCTYIIQCLKISTDEPTDHELWRAIRADEASKQKLDVKENDPRFTEAGNELLKELFAETYFPEFMEKTTRFLQEYADYKICDVCGGTGIKAVVCCNGQDCACMGLPVDFEMNCSNCGRRQILER
jgi:hypothetical protein